MNFATQIAPWLAVTGQAVSSIDEDQTGADDLAGSLLTFVADAGIAIEEGSDLPQLPEIVIKGSTEKLSKTARISLQVVAPVLVLAQFQVRDGRLKKILKYASQVLTQLLAGKPITVPVQTF